MVDTYGAPIDPARQAKIVEYLSQHYTPETIKRAPVPAVGPPPIPLPPGSGSRLYGQNCGGCHQDDGSGSQAFYPPLKTHAANLLKVPGGCTYLAYVVLFGLGGQFQLNGQTYAGAMPPMGSQLSDNEIAAILNFVATAWGNDKRLPKGFRKYTATEIGVARQAGLSASDVMIERAKMSIQH
ncbi:MAG: cytochrome c [Armatimonadetes bacterium]|nr:cytochrome c [Armatimonadota bacterium]